jgi:hypothetical protein
VRLAAFRRTVTVRFRFDTAGSVGMEASACSVDGLLGGAVSGEGAVSVLMMRFSLIPAHLRDHGLVRQCAESASACVPGTPSGVGVVFLLQVCGLHHSKDCLRVTHSRTILLYSGIARAPAVGYAYGYRLLPLSVASLSILGM